MRKSQATGTPVNRASSAPSPNCRVRPIAGRCSTVCPWKPTTAGAILCCAMNAVTAAACPRVSAASASANTAGSAPSNPQSRAAASASASSARVTAG